MTPGLAFFYAGFAREKSALNMLVENMAALGEHIVIQLCCGSVSVHALSAFRTVF